MNGLHYLAECSSTQDEVEQFCLSDGAETAVYTFNQTKGKGQYGNSWKSSANLNLAYSALLATERIKCSHSLFNYYTAIIVRDFIANMTSAEVMIKWPNDIIISSKKVCGILTEQKKIQNSSYFITGIGINVLQTDFGDLTKAGSVLTQTGKAFELHSFAEQLHQNIISKYSADVSENQILEQFNRHLFGKSKIHVFQKESARQNGIIKAAGGDGKLAIELEKDGLRRFFHKEIEMLY